MPPTYHQSRTNLRAKHRLNTLKRTAYVTLTALAVLILIFFATAERNGNLYNACKQTAQDNGYHASFNPITKTCTFSFKVEPNL